MPQKARRVSLNSVSEYYFVIVAAIAVDFILFLQRGSPIDDFGFGFFHSTIKRCHFSLQVHTLSLLLSIGFFTIFLQRSITIDFGFWLLDIFNDKGSVKIFFISA
ncbi:hypothetical protein F2P56_012294, partial [Juglans regia]